MQNGTSETLIGWKFGKTTYVPLWDRMEGAFLWSLDRDCSVSKALNVLVGIEPKMLRIL
jgi:hypothetical protein